ncbi:MAG: tetratricopeptide repeat protein [Myxococcales bacterium]|nr:tetratricopeptide repeat protein [Myxococcales bacterium]
MRIRSLAILGLLSLAAACAHSRSATKARAPVRSAEPIPRVEYPAESRRYMQMTSSDPDRFMLRDRLIATILVEAQSLADIDDYEGVIAQTERLADVLTPSDFATGVLPRDLEPIATFLADRGGRLGDEGPVLAAYYLLARLTEEERYQQSYDRIAAWGQEARSQVEDALPRYGQLLGVWTKHSDLTPAPEVLDTLAGLYIARRDALSAESSEARGQYGAITNRIWRIAPLDVAAVYLAHGDVESAITRVEGMGPGGDLQIRLLDLLRLARSPGEEGAQATYELVEGFSVARPDVTSGLCRVSLGRYPKDFRFRRCMARVAADEGQFADATAWYVSAIDLAPEMVELYDEALNQLDEFIESRLMDPHPERSSSLARGAEQILAARVERWPESPPPIAPDQLEFLIGMLEMNAGRVDEAEQRFKASIERDENANALLQLGLLLERTGRPEDAEAHYQRALSLTPSNTLSDSLHRAEILEHVGNAAGARGRMREMQLSYETALAAWSEAIGLVEGPTAALVEIRRGILLDHLGRHDQALDAFHSAMALAPQWREVYATILSHLVVSEPDFEFASTVWRRAQLQLNLPPEWKVYFTLWLQFIAARAEQGPSPEHTELLRRLGQPANWWGKLASFGAREISYGDLVTVASSLGEETEALFYEGTRLFVSGDRAKANAQFRRVLDTKMVSFYEYEMARKLLLTQSKPGVDKR